MPNTPVPAPATDLPDDEIAKSIEKESGERRWQEIVDFQGRHADWLEARSAYTRPLPKTLSNDAAELELEQRGERLRIAARDLMTTPATNTSMIWNKIEVFEHYLYQEGSYSDWTDRRDVWMLGCIKADLMQQGIGRAES